ncbi:MAG: DNA topology modulation protein FlaR [Alphaproteobacteria bacterium]
MKIHIIGGGGSGKSTFARKLAKEHNFPLLELDNIFWDNSVKGYDKKRAKEERLKLLSDFMQNESYIIEGVYYSWLDNSFETADKIYILDVNIHIRNYRILKRLALRKLGILQGKNDTLKSIINLIKWNFEHLRDDMPKIMDLANKYPNKVEVIKP